MDTLRNIPTEEHRQAMVDFHKLMSETSVDASFGERFLVDLSKFFGRKFTDEEVAGLYVLFLKNAIYLIVCQALPVFLQVVKNKDTKFLQTLSSYLTIVTPDELPADELGKRN
jgi:hypothetical protein